MSIFEVASLIVAPLTAMVISTLHRRQMRQNELFRTDPALGLEPPPGQIHAFLKAHAVLILGVGVPLVFLVQQLSDPSPITRWKVAAIAFLIGSIVLAIVLTITMSFIGKIVELLECHLGLTAKVVDTAKTLLERKPTPQN